MVMVKSRIACRIEMANSLRQAILNSNNPMINMNKLLIILAVVACGLASSALKQKGNNNSKAPIIDTESCNTISLGKVKQENANLSWVERYKKEQLELEKCSACCYGAKQKYGLFSRDKEQVCHCANHKRDIIKHAWIKMEMKST